MKIDFDKMGGLVPAVAQDYETNEVLMVAFMNEESFKRTLETGKACYWSRERKKLWTKGETSGNYQFVKSIMTDCDNDTILLKVDQIGNACHDDKRSCFWKAYKYDEKIK
jgi:phosphoribosyl-AMP cyclohydrolase